MPCSVLTVLHCISNCKPTAVDLVTAVTACCIAASRLQAALSLLQKWTRFSCRKGPGGNTAASGLQAASRGVPPSCRCRCSTQSSCKLCSNCSHMSHDHVPTLSPTWLGLLQPLTLEHNQNCQMLQNLIYQHLPYLPFTSHHQPTHDEFSTTNIASTWCLEVTKQKRNLECVMFNS